MTYYYYPDDPIPPPSTPPPDDENEWMAWSLGYVADVMTDLARKQSTEIARQEAEIKSLLGKGHLSFHDGWVWLP